MVEKVSIICVAGNLLFEETGSTSDVSMEKLADGSYFGKL